MSESVKLKDTLNSSWRTSHGFGQRMLAKMGWTEGRGLGKDESGIVENVKVKKREVGLGLGVESTTDDAGNKGWSETATSFSSVLDLLKQTYSKGEEESPKRKKEKKKERTSDKQKRTRAKEAIISVGIKYKKRSDAKDLSTKTEHELQAILGSARKRSSEGGSDSGGKRLRN